MYEDELILLHNSHGSENVSVLKRGTAEEIAAFLKTHGCQDLSHYECYVLGESRQIRERRVFEVGS